MKLFGNTKLRRVILSKGSRRGRHKSGFTCALNGFWVFVFMCLVRICFLVMSFPCVLPWLKGLKVIIISATTPMHEGSALVT